MIAKLLLNDNTGELTTELENGSQLAAETSEEMIEKLIYAGVNVDDLRFAVGDQALMIGQVIAIRYAFRCKANDDEALLHIDKDVANRQANQAKINALSTNNHVLSTKINALITHENIKPITNESDYKETLREVSAYFDNEPELNTPEGDRFEVLLALVEAYENKHYKIEPPDV
jgi:hypothetical protein